MLEAGEDARYIARRLVILASEEWAWRTPCAGGSRRRSAGRGVRGLPEAQLNLAQAVVHLATAPKSNRSAVGLWNALGDVRGKPAGAVPAT